MLNTFVHVQPPATELQHPSGFGIASLAVYSKQLIFSSTVIVSHLSQNADTISIESVIFQRGNKASLK